MPAWWWALPETDPTELGLFQVDSWGNAFLAMAIGILLLPLAAALVRGTAAASGALSRIVLGPSRRQLEERVEVLAQTRAGAVDAAAAELQRIERDLHDGAQARLVALALDLGMAEERFDRDPEGARELVEKARGEARLAHGRAARPRARHPPGAARPSAAWARRSARSRRARRCRRRSTSTSTGACPRRSSSAAYFTVAEALTNAVKHARARSAKVRAVARERAPAHRGARRRPRRRRPRRPRARRPAQAPGRARRHAGHRLAGRRPHRPVRGGPVRVVIAEDLALLREGISRLLNDHGFEVVAAVADGEAFLAAVDEHRPDVCVVDVRLPPGFKDEGVRAALEARRRIEGLPILVLSQYVERTYAAELLSDGRGGVGYLLKDRVAEVRDFVEAVRRVAEGGTALDPEAVSQLLGQRDDGPLDELTPRERDVLGLMAEGRSNVAIAEELVVDRGRGREARLEHLHEARPAALRARPSPRAGRAHLDARLTAVAAARHEHAPASSRDRNPMTMPYCPGHGAPHEDRRHDRPRLARSRGARAHGRGGHGRRAAELLPRHRRAARRDRAARARGGGPRRAPGGDPPGPPRPQAAHRRAARRHRRARAPATA